MEKDQREYFLRQQMKAIQKELGDMDEASSVVTEYTEKLAKANLPEEAKKEAERELKRLTGMSAQSPEYSMIKTYLDWMVELPWSTCQRGPAGRRQCPARAGRRPLRPGGGQGPHHRVPRGAQALQGARNPEGEIGRRQDGPGHGRHPLLRRPPGGRKDVARARASPGPSAASSRG